jgi:2-keto-4-pentenoate hydratase/2-oxohepta-3-ene-1,7-dioic acid hydratase in catechol pathway
MTISIVRTSDGWWVQKGHGVSRIDSTAQSTRELLADRAAIEVAAGTPQTEAIESLELLSPVSAPCRVVAQMANYASHAADAGMDPATVPLAFFRKSSGSISGPRSPIIRPPHVKFLDYEVEVGLVIGREMPVGTTITDQNWTNFVAGLVLTNDVSARDVQLTKTQFYESKSYPTFTPVGPALVLVDAGDLSRFGDLRLRLSVNGETRQNSTVDGDILYRPLDALRALTKFQHLDVGDLVLTGTPVGTALSAPPKVIEKIASLLPPATKWKLFFATQARNHKYLRDGDVVDLSVATDDDAINLGEQRSVVQSSMTSAPDRRGSPSGGSVARRAATGAVQRRIPRTIT